MGVEEVTAILGTPTNLPRDIWPRTHVVVNLPFLYWNSGPDSIQVTLGDDGKVSAKSYNPQTRWERLRWHVINIVNPD